MGIRSITYFPEVIQFFNTARFNTAREDITHDDYFVSNASGSRELEYSIHLTKSLANI